jgi:hypothetical protein
MPTETTQEAYEQVVKLLGELPDDWECYGLYSDPEDEDGPPEEWMIAPEGMFEPDEENEMPADLTKAEVKELLSILDNYTISKADLESAAKDVKNKMPKERPLDVSPLGAGKNWVTEVGGLPLYVRAIAHAIMRRGTPKGEAIAIAIGAAKRFLASRHTTAQTKARSGTALAQWEAMRAASRAKTGVKDVVNTAEDADKEVKKSGEVDRDEFLRNLGKKVL